MVRSGNWSSSPHKERVFFIDKITVQIHSVIVMIRWTRLAPWEYEFPFQGSLTFSFPSYPLSYCIVDFGFVRILDRSDFLSGDRGMNACPSHVYLCRHIFYPNIALPTISMSHNMLIDSWEGFHESRRCSRDTYPESHLTKYASIRRLWLTVDGGSETVAKSGSI